MQDSKRLGALVEAIEQDKDKVFKDLEKGPK